MNGKFILCSNPDCGIPIDPSALSCPKCDTPLRQSLSRYYFEIDVAHAGQTREDARQQIAEGLNEALLFGYKGLRVIHGHGGAHRSRGTIAREAKYILQQLATAKGYKLKPDGNNMGAHLIDFDT